MTKRLILKKAVRLAGSALLIAAGVTQAQAQEVRQILDRVQVYSASTILEADFTDTGTGIPLSGAIGADLKACQLTTTQGLWCLDGSDVVRFTGLSEKTPNAAVAELQFSCQDPSLDIGSFEGACTGLTVTTQGDIYLSGLTQDNFGVLHYLTPRNQAESCPAGVPLTNNPAYCVARTVSDRFLLAALSPVEGDLAANLEAASLLDGPGVLALEANQTATFFPEGSAPVDVVSGSNDWALTGGETLQSLALLQLPVSGADTVRTYVLATTSAGRVLAAETDGTPDTIEVYDVVANRSQRPPRTCPDSDADRFGLRTSSKTGIAYLSDRSWCEVAALLPDAAADGTFTQLSLATGGTIVNATVNTGAEAPLGPMTAPGITIDLAACVDECVLIAVDDGGNTINAATLRNVNATGEDTGLTLFQVTDIPDCRYVPQNATCVSAAASGRPLTVPASGPASQQALNVTPLLPREVLEQFETPLPDLFVPAFTKGQNRNNSVTFDAFFGISRANFTGVWELELEVPALTGDPSLGCQAGDRQGTPLTQLLQYDVSVKVSENYRSIDTGAGLPTSDPDGSGPISAGPFEANLVNVGCGSSRIGGARWSMIPFNLTFTPDHFGDLDPLDPVSPVPGEEADATIFLSLLQQQFDQLELTVTQVAGTAVDGQGLSAPLAPGEASAILSQIANVRDKLNKCIDATLDPKQSALNQTCKSFDSQMKNLERDLLVLSAPAGQDPANRIGELVLRFRVIQNVFDNLFFPSIPDEGFLFYEGPEN